MKPEKYLVALLMRNPELMRENFMAGIGEEYFADDVNREIFVHLRDGLPLTPLILDIWGRLEISGTAAYWAVKVREDKHSADRASASLEATVHLEQGDIEQARRALSAVQAPGKNWELFSKGWTDIYDELSEASNKGISVGMETGFTSLDRLTGGMKPGELWVVGGASSHGKSTWAMQVAMRRAILGNTVGFISTEMTRKTLLLYYASAQVGVGYNNLICGSATIDQVQSVFQWVAKHKDCPLFLYDENCFPDDLPGIAGKKDFNLVVIDYLQNLRVPRGMNRLDHAAKVAKDAKSLAAQIGCPVILLSQLSRAHLERPGDNRADGIYHWKGVPMKSDLKESGDIENAADMVVLVYRPALAGNDCPDDFGYQILAKQRTGATGCIKMNWYGQRGWEER